MAFITRDFVKESSTTTGTSDIVLAGARAPGQTFSTVLANGDQLHYAISHDTLNQWEVGVGTYNTGPNSITRSDVNVLDSSSGPGVRVSFAAGTKKVDLVEPATRIRNQVGPVQIGATSFGSGILSFAGTGVSFSLSTNTAGGTVHASVGAASAFVNFSAGTNSQNLSNVVFFDSNGVSFGLNTANSRITASINALGNIIIAGMASSVTAQITNATNTAIIGNSAFVQASTGLAGGSRFSTLNVGWAISSNSLLAVAWQRYFLGSVTAGGVVDMNVSLHDSNGVSFGAQTNSTATIATQLGRILTVTMSVEPRIGIVSHIGGNVVSSVTRLAFEDASGVSWSLSTAASAATVRATVGAGGGGITAFALSNAASSVMATGLTFSNANGFSFLLSTGASAATLSGSYTVPSIAGLISGMNVSAGASSVANATGITFTNSNNVGFAMSTAVGGATVRAAASFLASAGASSENISAITFANSNGVTFGLSTGAAVATLTASVAAAGGGASMNQFQPFPGEMVVQTISVGASYVSGSVWIMPVVFPQAVTMDRMQSLMSFTASTAQTVTHTISQFVALYTRNASTLSLAHSASNTITFNQSGSGNSSLIFGARIVTMPWTTTIPAGNYWLAFQRRLSGGATASHSMSHAMISQSLTFNFAHLGSSSNNTVQLLLGQGFWTATTASPPSSIAFSHISGPNSGQSSIAMRRPWLEFISQTA